jgi:predicted MFS family arabinose efflux permease
MKKEINEKLLIGSLFAINFTHMMDVVIMAPLNPFLKKTYAITTEQFGWLVSSYTLMAALGGLIAFFYIDKYNRRNAILFLYAGFFLANLLCAIAPGYKFFLLSRMFAGAFGGVLSSIMLSVVGDVIPMERRGKATGIVMAAFSGASVIGIPIGLWLAFTFNIHAPFVFLSLLSGLLWLFLYFKFPSIDIHLKHHNQSFNKLEVIKQLTSDSNAIWGLLFTFCVMASGFLVVPFISDYMVNNVGVPEKDLMYIYLLGGIATMITGPMAGRIADKIGKQKTYVITAFFSIPPILYVTMFPSVDLWVVLMFMTCFFVLFGARFVPSMTLLTSSVNPQKRGSFMSIASAVQQLSAALSVLFASLIITNTAEGKLENFFYVGCLAAIFTVIGIVLSYKVKEVS